VGLVLEVHSIGQHFLVGGGYVRHRQVQDRAGMSNSGFSATSSIRRTPPQSKKASLPAVNNRDKTELVSIECRRAVEIVKVDRNLPDT
jgi:hypothetical protein